MSSRDENGLSAERARRHDQFLPRLADVIVCASFITMGIMSAVLATSNEASAPLDGDLHCNTGGRAWKAVGRKATKTWEAPNGEREQSPLKGLQADI
jgi:hypothetical protein